MTVSENLVVHPAIELISLGTDRFQIVGVSEAFTIDDRDKHIRALFGWCDGTRTEEEIATLLSARVSDAKKLLDFLKYKQCIVPRRRRRPDAFLDYLDAKSAPLAPMSDTRRHGLLDRPLNIALVGSGALLDACLETFTKLGHSVTTATESAPESSKDIAVVLHDQPNHKFFRDINKQNFLAVHPTLFVSLDRQLVRIGPLVVPGESACFECYHHRLRSHLTFRKEFDARVEKIERPGDVGSAPWLAARAGSVLAATAVMGFLMENGTLGQPNQIVEQDLMSNTMTIHRLLKLPRCPVCGPTHAERIQPSIYAPYKQ